MKVSGFSIGFVFVEVSFSEDGSVGSVTGVDSPGVVEAGWLVKSVDEEVGRVIEATDKEEDDEVIGRVVEGNFGELTEEVDGMREDFIWLVEEDAEDPNGVDVGWLVKWVDEEVRRVGWLGCSGCEVKAPVFGEFDSTGEPVK